MRLRSEPQFCSSNNNRSSSKTSSNNDHHNDDNDDDNDVDDDVGTAQVRAAPGRWITRQLPLVAALTLYTRMPQFLPTRITRPVPKI